MQDFEETFAGRMESMMLNMIQQHLTNNNQQSSSPQSQTNANSAIIIAPDGSQLFTWGGKFHTIPDDFKMPKCTVKEIWDKWHFVHCHSRYGNIAPLHKIDSRFDLIDEKEKVAYSKAGFVVDQVVTYGKTKLNLVLANPPNLLSYEEFFDAVCVIKQGHSNSKKIKSHKKKSR